MVKNMKKFSAVVLLGILLVVNGCNQSPAPAYPKDMSSLMLNFPVPSAEDAKAAVARANAQGGVQARGVQARDVYLVYGTLKYRISSGTEVVSGAISVDYGTPVGTVAIPLPHNGTWLVSAEWFDYGYYPRFVGADQVEVAGTTQATLAMGDVTLSSCSYASIGDLGGACYYQDLFTFDTAFFGISTNGDTGDIKAAYDAVSGSEYFTTPGGTSLSFAYLGTGDWVNYTSIPNGLTYYPDTVQAKAAVVGTNFLIPSVKGRAMGPYSTGLNYYDVYLVQLSPTYHVWLQVLGGPYGCGSGAYTYFGFRVNKHGDSYMKYDSTTYGAANCRNLPYYGGGGG